jgi:CRP-like cAMP-binding protein
MQKLSLFLDQFQLPAPVLQALLQSWDSSLSIAKGDFLIREGQKERHLYFITSGVLVIYYEKDGIEQTVGFGYENTLICSFPSFIRDQPSDYYIKALSDTSLTGISRDTFYGLMEQHSELESLWRKMLEEALLGRIERELDLLTISPKDRLKRILDRSPHLFQLIPMKYIASYLRMAPETLSRNMKS